MTHIHHSLTTVVFTLGTGKGNDEVSEVEESSNVDGNGEAVGEFECLYQSKCLYDLHVVVSKQKNNMFNQVFVSMKTATDVMYDRTFNLCILNIKWE